MRATEVFILAITAALLMSCASNASHMRAQPAFQASELTDSGLPAPLQGRVKMKCMFEQDGNCVYTGIFYDHAATFATIDAPQRNAFGYVLLTTASDNCSWWLSRVFANRAGISSIRDTIKNLMTGAAALTAKPSPVVSAGLGFANLFADSSVKSVDTNEFASKTFDSIESAIKAKRNRTETEILRRLATATIEQYPIGALLLDVTRLKDECTLTSGIKGLQATASAEEQKSETERTTAQRAITGVKVP